MFKQSFTDLTKLPKDKVRLWLDSIKSVICDADGVLWHLDKSIEGAVDIFNELGNSGRNIFIVTNNAAISRADFHKKASNFGMKVDKDRILTSAYSCAHFLSAKKFQKKVFFMGEYGIQYELENAGLCCFKEDEKLKRPMQEFVKNLKLDPDVGAVVVGRDECFNMAKVVRAGSYLQNPKVIFLGTCLDAAYPICENRVMVGAGAMVAAIKTFTGRMPLVMGKPNPWMVDKLKGLIEPKSTLMVGDTLQTDILFAKNCGFQSLFVGTGVNSRKDVAKIIDENDPQKMDRVPDTYLPSFGHLLEFLR
ncbi:phosphoglycolate phosphatase 1B, chloroplastic [Drosophila serrata]|uniref:phosphoglycolate phosphatase 1B, chloroplastic n=1 Tax=Drosophila serrata TaxID=7274 RepID=UPI000A1D0527|nr:phosphoglycolate phosphatase 1B, chloroplastic [Drosophila serrata]XP_020809721.1 phosphoglycolate phosphatase 1B, chloroplastic [Drosophila serrata]